MRPVPIATVARYLLLDRVTYLVLPWAWAAFGFVLDAVILRLTPAGGSDHRWVGGLVAVFLVGFVVGVQSVARALPFALSLGVSRRVYFLGAVSLALVLAVGFGLVVAVGQLLERATGGWGLDMGYFRVPCLLDGPWYLSWLTAATAYVLMFGYGMRYGLVYRRAGLTGTMLSGGAQLGAPALAALVVTWVSAWADVGRYVGTLTATGVTGVLAAAVAVLLAGGYTTIRRLPL